MSASGDLFQGPAVYKCLPDSREKLFLPPGIYPLPYREQTPGQNHVSHHSSPGEHFFGNAPVPPTLRSLYCSKIIFYMSTFCLEYKAIMEMLL